MYTVYEYINYTGVTCRDIYTCTQSMSTLTIQVSHVGIYIHVHDIGTVTVYIS